MFLFPNPPTSSVLNMLTMEKTEPISEEIHHVRIYGMLLLSTGTVLFAPVPMTTTRCMLSEILIKILLRISGLESLIGKCAVNFARIGPKFSYAVIAVILMKVAVVMKRLLISFF